MVGEEWEVPLVKQEVRKCKKLKPIENVPEYLKENNRDGVIPHLDHTCKKFVRRHKIDLDPDANLFSEAAASDLRCFVSAMQISGKS